ncbi:hypothetical protein L208DRAFT_1413416 [Tricholoma matsutake]|nr:hypothetical protein L208DRAFT_1413416 [Tricholoma matsutake 945]
MYTVRVVFFTLPNVINDTSNLCRKSPSTCPVAARRAAAVLGTFLRIPGYVAFFMVYFPLQLPVQGW